VPDEGFLSPSRPGDPPPFPQEPEARKAPGTTETAGFGSLGLSGPLVAAVAALGYEEPTPIQREAIPVLLAGRDVLGQAATGTGKTAAFALPLLQRIAEGPATRGPHDRARPRPDAGAGDAGGRGRSQVRTEPDVHVAPLFGGAPMDQQVRALKRGVEAAVATPGRALDHIRRGNLKLGELRFLVLDEADEMLDMGFAEDLEAILAATPATRQTALFSATIPSRIVSIAQRHMRDPVRVTIGREKPAAGKLPRLRQTAYVVPRGQKPAALARVLEMENPASAIVFCRTRLEVDELTETLNAHGYRGEALHGGMAQRERDRVMRLFRSGKADLLVATDVAARGLDIAHVSHVVNYDVPSAPEAYLHRVGRTGRVGRAGVAITIAEPREQWQLRNIEAFIKQKIAIAQVPTPTDLHARRLDRRARPSAKRSSPAGSTTSAAWSRRWPKSSTSWTSRRPPSK
jgi:ATP-dependent RNA helicase DeaD